MGIFKNIFKEEVKEEPVKEILKPETNEEINAVIGAAVFLYTQELHDFENYALTIKRIDRVYSPWSSKIYGLRKWPRG